MTQPPGISPTTSPSILDLARCLACTQRLRGESCCIACGRAHPVRDGIVEAIGPLSGRNRIVADFYDGPGWARFQPWEQLFLLFQGGIRRARMEMLRHVVELEHRQPIMLEVGIGSGENLPFLPPEWTVHGVDIARTQLEDCRRRHPETTGRLAWAEAENLPFDDATFDACWSIGGFNYYSDHETALREMRRVTRPGGPVVIADELPRLYRAGLGHLLGIPSLDAWWLNKLGLDREFVEMVFAFDIDLTGIFSKAWPGATRYRIWHGLGYCVVNHSNSSLEPII
jgi:SAM-dependent methyltransferase